MNKIHLLDCTLRDGGYVNEWNFGKDNINEIFHSLCNIGLDYVEVGFMQQCEYDKDIVLFNRMDQVSTTFGNSIQKKAVIVSVGDGYPETAFPERTDDMAELIRVMIRKRSLDEGFAYCSHLRKLGYDVGIQLVRAEQYEPQEYAELMQKFSTINPVAIYVVDSFGLLNEERLLRYAEIADDNIGEGIFLGYHAHNNMQQAFSNSVALIKRPCKHEIILDASVLGMGRGAGNLQLELILKYLNEKKLGQYNESPTIDIAERVTVYHNMAPWGYSMPYYLSAINGRNPSFVPYLENKKLTIPQISKVFQTMKARNVGTMFDKSLCDSIIDEVLTGSY